MDKNRIFENQVVVVTGAARGIGLATAKIAACRGAKVIVSDIDENSLEAVARQIGARATAMRCDVSDLAQVRQCVDQIIRSHGQIDVLINNAAVTSYHPPELLPEAVWRRELDVVLTGPFFWAQTVGAKSMIPRRTGSIVNLGSGAGLAGTPRAAAYVSAKHGIIGLTKSLSVDWGQFGIRVNCVCPGLTFTELAQSVADKNPQMMKERENRIPLGRGATPADVAEAILFLASRDAAAISGAILAVDGGTIAMSSGFSAPRDNH